MASTNRTGRVSAIDYEAGTYEVTYFDRGKSVTRQINAMSNGESTTPRPNGACFAVAAGAMAATPGCSIPACTARAPMPAATSGAVPLFTNNCTLRPETLNAER